MLFNDNWLINYESPLMWEGFRQSMLQSPISPDEDPEEIKGKRNQMIDVFREVSKVQGTRYILSETAHETIKRIKIDKIDIRKFSEVVNHAIITVVIDRKSFYRFVRIKHEDHFDQIWCAKVFCTDILKRDMQQEAYFDIFTLDLQEGYMDTYQEYLKQRREHELQLDEYIDGMTKEELMSMEDMAIKLLTYLYLADIDFETIKAKGKIKKEGGKKFVNQTNRDIILVDSKWHTEILREEGFEVKGHLRLQPYGVGRMKTKLIWIDNFQKNGYHRRAGRTVHRR